MLGYVAMLVGVSEIMDLRDISQASVLITKRHSAALSFKATKIVI